MIDEEDVENLPFFVKESYRQNNEVKAKNYKERGYDLDLDLSDRNTHVAFDPVKKKLVVVHRGSKTFYDWAVTDPLSIADRLFPGAGTLSSRLYKAKTISDKAREKYDVVPIQVGHSLGGYVAETTAGKDEPVMTYNKIGLTRWKNNPNQYDFARRGDIVSIGNNRNNPIDIKTPGKGFVDSHSTRDVDPKEFVSGFLSYQRRKSNLPSLPREESIRFEYLPDPD